MNWREQRWQAMDLMDSSMHLLETGRLEEAIAAARESNRLMTEAIAWRWEHDPPPSFVSPE